MLIHDFLIKSAINHPNKTAIIHNNEMISYNELLVKSTSDRALLYDNGFSNGDRVLIKTKNKIDAVSKMFGTLMAGGCFSIISPNTKKEKTEYILENYDPFAFFEEKNIVIRKRKTTIRPISSTDTASIIYTSGSTGIPKGVCVSHQNIYAACKSITKLLANNEKDTILSPIPLSFDYGLYQVIMSISFQGTVILDDNFFLTHDFIRKIEKHTVTGLPVVPSILNTILKSDLNQYETGSLRYITNTADTLSKHQICRLREDLPKTEIFSMYGLTECKRVSFLPPDKIDEIPDSVGIPIPFTDAFIVNEKNERLPNGSTGELVVRGPHIMIGYWRDQELTNHKIGKCQETGDRIMYTGDIFRTDTDGYLYFVSRKDDMFKNKGQKIYPKEIELILLQIPEVFEACVIPSEENHDGKQPIAFISLKKPLEKEEVLKKCKEKLDKSHLPKDIYILHEIQKNDNGKPDKSILREKIKKESVYTQSDIST